MTAVILSCTFMLGWQGKGPSAIKPIDQIKKEASKHSAASQPVAAVAREKIVEAATTTVATTATTTATTTVQGLVDCGCEKKFDQPIAVSFEGGVIASFVSGSDLGVQSMGLVEGHDRFYIVGDGAYDYSDWTGRRVSIKGKLTGITCAYANTVFGVCAAEIEAQAITALK